jgi:hypothetical protein
MENGKPSRRLPKAYAQDDRPVEEGDFFKKDLAELDKETRKVFGDIQDHLREYELSTESIPKVQGYVHTEFGTKEALARATQAKRMATIAVVFASLSLSIVVIGVCLCLYLLGSPLALWFGLPLQCT